MTWSTDFPAMNADALRQMKRLIDRLAWVAGLGVDVKFACPAGEAGVMPVWEPN